MGILPRTDREDDPDLLQRAARQTSASVLRLKADAESALRSANAQLKRQAEQLAASASLLQATLEATSDAIIAVDLEGRIVVHNSHFEQLWKVAPGTLERGQYAEVCAHIGERVRDEERYVRMARLVRDHPEGFSHEVFELIQGGTYERYAGPQRVDGRCVGTVIRWRDITERVRAAEVLRAKEVAERMAQARAEFLARMSHELRTPLNAVIGFADLLQLEDSALSPDQQRFVGHIRRAGANLLLLINDVLELSSVDAGTLTITLADVDAAALVREVVAQAAPQARARGVQVVARPPEAPLRVRADRTRLRQVLLNLVSNAIKYNRVGGHVAVGLDVDESRVRIAVTDDGLGMNAEQVAALYQPFNRLGREQGDVEGTGIGLVIARSLTELMGGRITVRSEVNSGSEFVIDLEACAAADQVTEVADSAPAPLIRNEIRGRVLYIDDGEVNRVLMEAFLAHRPGIALTLAADGESGLRLARARPPDLVLLDVLLPGMDGFAVLRELRTEPSLEAVACVAVSANALPDEIDRALAAGFDGYLTKPLTLATALNEIDRRLGSAHVASK